MVETIKQIIKNGEGISVEFKEAKNKLPKSLFETICAFLNRFGGSIILGVSDNGEITGVDKNSVPQMKKDFATLCNNPQKISPTISLGMEDYEIDGKTILFISVPVSADVHRSNNIIYDRNADGDFDVTDNTHIVSGMYIRKRDVYIESKIFPYATMEDLNEEVFEKVKKLARAKNENHPWLQMTNEEILRSAGLYRKDAETQKEGLILAAILIFGKDETIMSCLPQFKTDAIYRNENMERYDDRDVIITNLIDSYTRLMDFVRKHTNDKFYLNKDSQVEMIRDNLAREICVNLLIHRELSDGATSRIIITKDYIYTENPSRPRYRGFLTVDNYIPYSKNPKIAKVFREIGLADELGSGVRRITDYTRIYSGKDPVMEEGDVFKVTIPLNRDVEEDDLTKQNNGTQNEKFMNTPQDKLVTPQDTPQDKSITPQDNGIKVNEISILEYCKNAKSVREIVSHFGYSDIKSFKAKYINPLLNTGKLKMTIPDKPTSRNQKYISSENN